MSHMKNNSPSGVITIHTPYPIGLLTSEEADVKDDKESRKSPYQPSARSRNTCRCVRPGKRNEASPSGPKQGPKQDWLSHTSLRRLQAKMESNKQQAQEIIQPLLDTKNSFMKELDCFLSQRDVTELRRRELLHKRWTTRVWIPLQKRVEEQVSSCSPVEAMRWQGLYSDYLRHCNTKGFVFLETFNLREYNPFLLKMQQYLKEPLYLNLYERLKETTTSPSCGAGCKYKRTEAEEPPQRDRPFRKFVTSQADKLTQASTSRPASAYIQISLEDDTRQRKSSRLDNIPHHISATSDGRCHQTSCWFSNSGC